MTRLKLTRIALYEDQPPVGVFMSDSELDEFETWTKAEQIEFVERRMREVQ